MRSNGHWLPAILGSRESLDPQNPENPTPEEAASSRAAELLRDNSRCSNFITELIALTADIAIQPFNAPPTPNFLPMLSLGPLLWERTFEPNIGLMVYNIALSQGRVTASGASGRSGNVTTYGTTTGHRTIAWHREFYALGLDDRALMTLHESLHLFNNFTDFAIADAAHMLATRNRTSPGRRGNFTNSIRCVTIHKRPNCSALSPEVMFMFYKTTVAALTLFFTVAVANVAHDGSPNTHGCTVIDKTRNLNLFCMRISLNPRFAYVSEITLVVRLSWRRTTLTQLS